MGCMGSKPDETRKFDKKASSALTKSRSQDKMTPSRTTSIGDFKVSHSDFVGPKTSKIESVYSLLRPPIGKGAYGEVKKAVHRKTNVQRAVKIIYKTNTKKDEAEQLINEVNILRELDHPNIMKILEFYEDEKCFYIVSEFYDGGELFEKIAKMKYFSEKQAAQLMKQILSAVAYCHANNIVHRDLKPENILFEGKKSDSLVKVIDFGTSRFYETKNKMNGRFGTPYYIAPEVINRKYTEKCDNWSCGVILYILLCGYPPFNGETEKEIMNNILAEKWDFSPVEFAQVSNEAKALIKKLLTYDPKHRITAEQALQDPWFKMALGENQFDQGLAVSALTNLKTFRARGKLQEATWIFLVTNLASKEEKSSLLKTFQALDTNGDGMLSREELINGYEKIMSSTEAEKEVDEIMKAVDNNQSGAIDYTEFVMATINRKKMLSKERLEAIFKMIDKDGNGFLDADELKEIFNPGNQREIDDNVWVELIKEVDDNGDGQISYQEFKEMMLKLLG